MYSAVQFLYVVFESNSNREQVNRNDDNYLPLFKLIIIGQNTVCELRLRYTTITIVLT